MKILFVGSNPSIKNLDPSIPFEGTKSAKILDTWVKFLQINDYHVINILDKVTENNRPLSKREIRECLYNFRQKIKDIEYDKIIALGNTASVALKMLGLEHFKLNHPSPKNRKLNDKESLQNSLNECKVFIWK